MYYVKLLLYTGIVLVNLFFLGSSINTIIVVPQVLHVLYLIGKKRYEDALMYHIIYIALSIATTTAVGLLEAGQMSTDYASLKLIGPIRVSYVISIILFVAANSVSTPMKKDNLGYKLFQALIWMATTGTFIGAVGCFIDKNYRPEMFMSYGVYIYLLIITIYCFQKFYSSYLLQRMHNEAEIIIVAGIFASFISYAYLGVKTTYGVLEDLYLTADVMRFAPILLFAIFKTEHKKIVLLALFIYSLIIVSSGGGKDVMFVIITAVYFGYALFFSKHLIPESPHKSLIKGLVGIVLLLVIVYGASSVTTGAMFDNKLGQALSFLSFDLNEMDRSPLIRVASFLNIINDNKFNPIGLLFGQGIGGYFTDSLHMFTYLDVAQGGWSQEIISSGCYPSAHDTFASVPLVYGFVGLYLLMRVAVQYIKRVPTNCYALAAVLWLVLTFNFNVQLALIALFLLYCSEYNEYEEYTNN